MLPTHQPDASDSHGSCFGLDMYMFTTAPADASHPKGSCCALGQRMLPTPKPQPSGRLMLRAPSDDASDSKGLCFGLKSGCRDTGHASASDCQGSCLVVVRPMPRAGHKRVSHSGDASCCRGRGVRNWTGSSASFLPACLLPACFLPACLLPACLLPACGHSCLLLVACLLSACLLPASCLLPVLRDGKAHGTGPTRARDLHSEWKG